MIVMEVPVEGPVMEVPDIELSVMDGARGQCHSSEGRAQYSILSHRVA
jgi:hypothetical protein